MSVFQPLRGVKVLDLGRLMPSGMATAELARLGADVVKIEMPPYGDYLRINPPLVEGRGDMHLEINRNKRSLGLTFNRPEGREVLLRLAESTDVFVELSRPGAMRKLGLDYPAVAATNPDVIYASFSGFGQEGPYAHLAAHGLSADGASGFLPYAEQDGRRVLPDPYLSVGPRAAGAYGAVAILGALYGRATAGGGQYLDVAQGDAAVAWNYREAVLTANTGKGTPSYRDLGPRYDVYECSDGRYVLFAATEPRLWRRFCESVERPDLAADTGDEAVEYVVDEDVRSALEDILGTRTRDDWIALGLETGIPITPVLDPSEITSDPHIESRGMVQSQRHPLGGRVWVTGHPVHFGDKEVAFFPAPELGQHSVEVLEQAGFAESEISALVRDGVVQQWVPK